MTSNKINIDIDGKNNNTNIILKCFNSILNNKKTDNNIVVPYTNDTTPPTITLDPSYVTFEASLTPYIDNSSNIIISDNLFNIDDLTIEISNNVISNVVGTYSVIYTVTDPCNNVSQAIRTVNVVDTTPPVITLNGASYIQLVVNSEYNDLGASATDIVDGNLSNSINIQSDLCNNTIGNYNIIYSVTDSCGNTSSAIRNVLVIDNVAPTIILDPSIITIEISNNPYIDNSSNDIIADNYFTVDELTIELSNNVISNTVGTYNVTYTVTDPCNNVTQASRIVNVVDNLSNSIMELLLNPSVTDYQIPVYYTSSINSNSNITFGQPSSYYNAYCVPTSFANVLNYYSDISGKNLAIQINYTSQNSYPPLTDFLYNYQSRPLTDISISDVNKIDLGYILNTNAHGFDISDGSYTGTRLDNFSKFTNFMSIVSPNTKYKYFNKGFNNDISYAYTNISNEVVTPSTYSINDINNVFNEIKSNITNEMPIILSFTHWNIIFNNSYGTSGITNISGNDIYLYDFSGQVGSTADIQSSNELYNNSEYISEIWDIEAGLGHTVTCVGYIENVNNKNWVVVQDNVNNFGKQSNDPTKTPKYVGVPLDASYLAMVTYIDFSSNGLSQINNLNCLLTDSSVNIVNSSGNKYVFNNSSTYDETLKYGLYDGTYVINNIPSAHPIAFLNNDVSNLIQYDASQEIININVGGGSFSDPYYTFSPDINATSFNFIPGYTYRFTGTNISSSHPFYISDVGRNQQSTELTFSGNGSFSSGITGTQSFEMTIPYNFTKSSITYYCTAHSSMVKSKSIVSSLIDGIYYKFYYDKVRLNVNGDFGTISAYCLYHGYMGSENKFTYTNVCNPSPFYTLSSNVSSIPVGYNGTIRLSSDGNPSLDFSFNEINNDIYENPNKLLSLYIENNEIKIKVIDVQYDNYRLETIMFNLYDELNNFVDASISLEKVNITIDNYVFINNGNNYFYIEVANGTPNENKLTISTNPSVIGIIV